MFTVRVMMTLKPDARPALLTQLGIERRDVPERFPGCRHFAAFPDPDDVDRALLYEEWSDRAAFEAYRQSSYFEESGAVLWPLLDGAPDSAYFESELVGP
jgi:quinol monooxygenase YgiN